MKRRPVTFTLKVHGLVPDQDSDALIATLNNMVVGIVGFTLEMNGVDNVYVALDQGTIDIGDSEDYIGQTQAEKVADVIGQAAEAFDAEVVEVNEYDVALKKDTVH